MKWVLGGFVLYALIFIWNSSFVIDGTRFFCLFDDAMISMRYAWNFANGNGLVWNVGEYVEGITNLLWTLYMSLWQWLPPNLASLPIQLSGMVLLGLNVYVIYRMAGIIPATLTAFYLPLNYWGLLGMETALVTLVITSSVYFFTQDKNRIGYVILGLGFLVRPDLVLLFPFVMWWKKKDIVFALSVLFIFVGGMELFRWVYYGELLPNTYYVKMTGYPMYLRWTRGAFYFLKQYSLFILILGAFFFIFMKFYSHLKKTRNQEGTKLLLNIQANNHFIFYIVLIQLVYNIHIGGDVWDFWAGGNRFVVSIAPLVFVLLGRLLFHLLHVRKMLIPMYGKIFLMLAFVWLLHSRLQMELFFVKPSLHIEDHKQKTELALEIKKEHPSSIAVTWAGIIMYFNPEAEGVDILGKSDKYIARLPMQEVKKGMKRWIGFNPGHMKWDYEYSLSKQPEIITSLWNLPEKADLSMYRDTTLCGQQIWIRNR